MRLSPLIELRVEHGFCTEPGCVDLRLDVRPSTTRLLARHRLRPSALGGGIRLSLQRDDDGRALVPLPDEGAIEVLICTDDRDFALYTDMGEMPAGTFASYAAAAGNSGGRLRPGEPVPRTIDDPRDAVALVVLPVSLLREGAEAGTIALHLTLPARRSYWRYYCIVPASVDAGALAVVGTGGAADAGEVDFPDAAVDHGVDGPADDPVASGLRQRFPGRRIVSLTSAARIAARSPAGHRLALALEGNRIVDPLPGPALSSLLAASQVPAKGATAADVIFATLDVTTHPAHDSGA